MAIETDISFPLSDDPLENENPETLRLYARIFLKPKRNCPKGTMDADGRASFLMPPGAISLAAAKALNYMATMIELRAMTEEQREAFMHGEKVETDPHQHDIELKPYDGKEKW